MTKILRILMETIDKLLKPFSWIASKLEGQYDKRFRYISQTIFVIGLAIMIFSPVAIYVVLILLQLQPPYCYVGFGFWLVYIGFIILLGVYIEYRRGKELLKSFSKEPRGETAKYINEIFKPLRKREAKNKSEQ